MLKSFVKNIMEQIGERNNGHECNDRVNHRYGCDSNFTGGIYSRCGGIDMEQVLFYLSVVLMFVALGNILYQIYEGK